MSGCEFYQELISRMLDEELSGEESAVLAEHLDSCEECRSVYSAFTALSASIAEDLVDAPESIKINVMTEVRRSELIKKNKKKSMKRLFATAACLVLVAGAAYMALPELADKSAAMEAAMVEEVPAEAPAAAAPVQNSITDSSVAEAPAAAEPAAVAEESAVEESFEAEEIVYGSFTLRKADEDNGIELFSTVAVWDELAEILGGVEAEISTDEISAEQSFTVSYMLEDEVQTLDIILAGELLYYTDPVDGIWKQSPCSPDNLAFFLT